MSSPSMSKKSHARVCGKIVMKKVLVCQKSQYSMWGGKKRKVIEQYINKKRLKNSMSKKVMIKVIVCTL